MIWKKKPQVEEELPPMTWQRKVLEWVEVIVTALVLALIIRAYVVQAFKIPSGSMIPTLEVGDHILVNKFLYGTKIPFTDKQILPFKDPQRGDIIVFKFPMDETRDFIKRIVGVAGDEVMARDKQVFVNGEPLDEPFTQHVDPTLRPSLEGCQGAPWELPAYEMDLCRDTFGPITVPEGKYFVMGDNRDQSHDSRFWGFVDREQIRGKALVIYWSWNGERHLPRLGRIGNLVR